MEHLWDLRRRLRTGPGTRELACMLVGLIIAAFVMATGGFAILAGGAAGAATGYVAGHEAAK